MNVRLRCHILLNCLNILAVAAVAGCGGGGSQQLPPPTPDFVLNLSSTTATINQGASSPAIQVGVQPLNGFSGNVQINLTGMPSGVTASPQSPFTVASGGNAMLMLGASMNASVGNASISVQAASGGLTHSKTIALTVQGPVAGEQVYPKAGFYKFILYDQKRQWVYLSNTDHLDVFDLNATIFRSGILPPGGPPPNALIRQAALTPDSSQLLVADFGAQSVYLIDPDTAAGTSVNVGGVSGDANSGPVRVAATSTKNVFVGLAGFPGGASPCSACLQQMDLAASPVSVESAPQPQISTLTGAPFLDASADGTKVFLYFATAAGQPVAQWSAATPGQFTTAQTNFAASDTAVASDGTFIAARNSGIVEIRDANFNLLSTIDESGLDNIPQRTDVPGIAMHPSGALVYLPFLIGPAPVSAPFTGLQSGMDIVDAHTGQLRLSVMLPEPLAMLAADIDSLHARFMTVDENGERVFALTASGLTVLQLSQVPLGIGSLTPAAGSAAGGTNVTIRGSGFVSGATVTIGGLTAATTFVDMNTLKITTPVLTAGAQSITITNPDGKSVSLNAAFTPN
jgi:hypothetical protein